MQGSYPDDYEQYLTRRRLPNEDGRLLNAQDFERLICRIDELFLLNLERALSPAERRQLQELMCLLDLDDPVPEGSLETADAVLSDEWLREEWAREEWLSEDWHTDSDGLVQAENRQVPRCSRLGSPRPDARRRRSRWQQQRRSGQDHS